MKQFPVVTYWEEKNFTLHTHKTKEKTWGLEELLYLRLLRVSSSKLPKMWSHYQGTLGRAELPLYVLRNLKKTQHASTDHKNVHNCFVDSSITPPAGRGKNFWNTSFLSAKPLCPHNPQQPLLTPDMDCSHSLWNWERQEVQLEKQLFFSISDWPDKWLQSALPQAPKNSMLDNSTCRLSATKKTIYSYNQIISIHVNSVSDQIPNDLLQSLEIIDCTVLLGLSSAYSQIKVWL